MSTHNRFLVEMSIFMAVGYFLPVAAKYTESKHLAFMAFCVAVGAARGIYKTLKDNEAK
jgi:hypothetical protein